MKCLKVIGRKGWLALVALAGWLAIHGTTLAAALRDDQARAAERSAATAASSGGGTFVLSYTIAVLCVGLGVFFACRPSRRRDRARPEEFVNLYKDEDEGGSAEKH